MDREDYERYHQQKKEHYFTPRNNIERFIIWYALVIVATSWVPIIFFR